MKKYSPIFPRYADNLESFLYPQAEEIVNLPDKKQDSFEKLFSNKSKTLKATVRELLNEINLRKSLDSSLISEINNEICKAETYLHEINDACARIYGPNELKFGRRRTQLEDRILNLEQEKRKEDLEFWRDSMFLKKYLMSALTDYWQISNKGNILENDEA